MIYGRFRLIQQQKDLVLKTSDEIEEYVLSVVKDYLCTTKMLELISTASFYYHDLDSSTHRYVIRIEDELGYVKDSKDLKKFNKPRHVVNFIKHFESSKTEFNRLPHENNKYHFHFEEPPEPKNSQPDLTQPFDALEVEY